jgi:hypothetical protein
MLWITATSCHGHPTPAATAWQRAFFASSACARWSIRVALAMAGTQPSHRV